MKAKINFYFASLLITVAGAGAALIIIHVATASAYAIVYTGGTRYVPLP
ncbi:hypothetical protein HY972_02110 [Candidatus Kaiserbacteria bacterium]|nr:hypothetical protein [Candidatus Kaiserbacteria bacterium]